MDTDLLNGIPLFAQLTGMERAELSALMTVRQLKAQETLFWVGDQGAEFFIIQSGRLTISCPDQAGAEITLAQLGPGDFLGEISLLDDGPRTATARAHTDATLLVLSRETFHQFLGRCPSVAIHLLTVLGRRQRDSVEKLRGIKNANEVMDQQMTRWQRVAHTIAATAASQAFLLSHAIGFGGWIVVNLLLGKKAIDPFPFLFLCFWASVEAIFLSLFIMISQNVQGQKDRIRTELEYQIALKMQLEIMQLHQKMDELPGALAKRLAKETSGELVKTAEGNGSGA